MPSTNKYIYLKCRLIRTKDPFPFCLLRLREAAAVLNAHNKWLTLDAQTAGTVFTDDGFPKYSWAHSVLPVTFITDAVSVGLEVIQCWFCHQAQRVFTDALNLWSLMMSWAPSLRKPPNLKFQLHIEKYSITVCFKLELNSFSWHFHKVVHLSSSLLVKDWALWWRSDAQSRCYHTYLVNVTCHRCFRAHHNFLCSFCCPIWPYV